ncbi:hypothetical protein D9M69_632400 [compost metagenome]
MAVTFVWLTKIVFSWFLLVGRLRVVVQVDGRPGIGVLRNAVLPEGGGLPLVPRPPSMNAVSM